MNKPFLKRKAEVRADELFLVILGVFFSSVGIGVFLTTIIWFGLEIESISKLIFAICFEAIGTFILIYVKHKQTRGGWE